MRINVNIFFEIIGHLTLVNSSKFIKSNYKLELKNRLIHISTIFVLFGQTISFLYFRS